MMEVGGSRTGRAFDTAARAVRRYTRRSPIGHVRGGTLRKTKMPTQAALDFLAERTLSRTPTAKAKAAV